MRSDQIKSPMEFQPDDGIRGQQAGAESRGDADRDSGPGGAIYWPGADHQDESQFHKIQVGDVMVCPMTSPVWSVLFPSVGALITDSGGLLSHPAIIAREYRIPAVVVTGNATSLLQDGQTGVVNGTTGNVERLD